MVEKSNSAEQFRLYTIHSQKGGVGKTALAIAIAEGLKAESVERYIRDAFDRHVTPNSWEQKVEIIRQFIGHCGTFLSSSIQANQPERYARDYRELIHSYVAALQRTSSIFRRL